MNVLALCGPFLNQFQCAVLLPFLEPDSRHPLCASLVDERPREPKVRRLWRNLRQGRGGYVGVLALKAIARTRASVAATDEFLAERGIPVIGTRNPYSEGTLAAVRELNPDVMVLVSGFGIVKPPLLEAAPNGILSYHHGDLRRYRGQPPAFWELYNGEKEMGITVQRISAGVDSGEPIVERHLEIRVDDTVRSLSKRSFAESADMMFAAVDRLGAPGFVGAPLDSLGPLYTLPNLRQWLLLNGKISVRVVRTRLFSARAGAS